MTKIKYPIRLLGIFVEGMAVLFAAMILVWCIPDEWVADKRQESLSLFDENGREDEWPFTREGTGWKWVFTHARGSQLDNSTDHTMLINALADDSEGGHEEASVLYRAMDCNDYARYWHGYLLFLRPLLTCFSYMQIRYIYMFLYMLLGAAVMLRLQQNFGNRMVYLWVFCSCFIYPVILPFSLQFSSVFFIMLAAILMTDRIDRNGSLQRTGIFFLILGMLTSYFDFFTAPLLTLGVPLIYLMMLRLNRSEGDSFRENMAHLLLASVTWGGGYFGCWAMKWVLASPILGRNVIREGLDSFVRRTVSTYHTSNGYDTGSLRAIAMNLFAILPPGITSADWKWFFCLLVIIVLVLAVIFMRFHTGRRELKEMIPFVIVAFYPYIWFAMVSQHTSIHYLFTYRIELITLLGLSVAYVGSLRVRRGPHRDISAAEQVREREI